MKSGFSLKYHFLKLEKPLGSMVNSSRRSWAERALDILLAHPSHQRGLEDDEEVLYNSFLPHVIHGISQSYCRHIVTLTCIYI